jgi:uncharacterized membrane protein
VTEDFEPNNGEEFEEKVPITEEPMSSMDGISDDDKLWAALAYVFTPLVPIIVLLLEDKKTRAYIKLHSMQALVWGIAFYLIVAITSPFVIGLCLWPLGFIVQIYWAYQAYQGQGVTIPFLSDFVKQQGWA